MTQLVLASTMWVYWLAPADRPALQAATTQRIEAVSATPVRFGARHPDGRIVLHQVGQAMPLQTAPPRSSSVGGIVAGAESCSAAAYASCPEAGVIVFDAFEPDPASGAPTDTGRVRCGIGGGRWHFGNSHLNPHYVNDMRLCAAAGGEAYGVDLAWKWGASPAARPMMIAILTAEDFDDSCRGEAASGHLGGILYSFGESAGGDFHANLDLCATGLTHRLPADGAGAYIVMFGDFENDVFHLDGFAGTQPFLWGTDPERPGIQFEVQWDDVNPTDGEFAPLRECFSYRAGLCPFPLGGMLALRGRGDCNPCDTNCDGKINNADVAAFMSLLSGESTACSPCAGDCNRDGAVDQADVAQFVKCLGVCADR